MFQCSEFHLQLKERQAQRTVVKFKRRFKLQDFSHPYSGLCFSITGIPEILKYRILVSHSKRTQSHPQTHKKLSSELQRRLTLYPRVTGKEEEFLEIL